MSKFAHIKTWLFDLDDTLYAPATGFSKHMAEVQHQSLAKMLGVDLLGIKTVLTDLVAKHGGAPFTGLYKEKSIDMDAFIEEGFVLRHDMLEPCALTRAMLESMQGRKVIFTNSPKNHANNILKRLGYEHIFEDEYIFDVTRLNFETKPKIEPYQKVLTDLKEEPQNCLLIEDSLANLKTAKELGMTTVSVHVSGEKLAYVDYAYEDIQSFLADATA